ncbi:GNAT family N-acetyltransferase [Massilia psychrophila]|uniref:GNAT family N-acetyltransferase n=3 Tax=Massilia psychrophila TaxID=1603353 RepID=A0A2G8T2D8_9BURK|nr:GNAT family N-acetyltransferase [Massilia psychrophila]
MIKIRGYNPGRYLFYRPIPFFGKSTEMPKMQSLINTNLVKKSVLQAIHSVPHSVPTETVTISCYENAIPSFVETELDRLYKHINSSLSHHAVQRKANGASTYVARKGEQAIAILLFKREKRKVSVINEMIDIAPEELERFASYIFSNDKSIAVISFSLIGDQIGSLPFPCHQYEISEDIVLTLPATPEAYLDSLSSKMRRNIRRYLRAIARDNSTFRFEVCAGDEINEKYLHDLIDLKKINIGQKNIRFGIDPDEVDWIVRQAKLSGLVTVALIGNRVCGGSISLRVNDHYFGQIISYDPAYQKYSLGILCCYQAICDQISLGAKESHLCWGRYQYKYKLMGVQRDRASLDIYRSRSAYWQNAGTVLIKTVKTCLQEWKKRLLNMEHEENPSLRFGPLLVKTLRKIKRFRMAGDAA